MELCEVSTIQNGAATSNANDVANCDEKRGGDILYGIDDIPPWYLAIPMAFQVGEW